MDPSSLPAIPAPDSSEYAPFYAGYVAAAGSDVARALAEQPSQIEALLGNLDEEAARYRYADGKWSIKEVLGHLTDGEWVFAYRLLRISRGDTTPLPGFDEKPYVAAAHSDERPLADLIHDFRSLRQATLRLIDGIRPEAWSRLGNASNNPVSARALAYILAGHVNHHLGVLRERYGLANA